MECGTGDNDTKSRVERLLLIEDDSSLPAEDRELLAHTLEFSLEDGSTDIFCLLRHITRLRFLEKLSIRSNSLETLPESLAGLTRLRSFTLSRAPLEALPGWISSWTNLTALDLSWSGLRCLPPEIGQLKHLTQLNLTGLTLHSLPPSLAVRGLPFYFERFDPGRPGICLCDTVLTAQPTSLFRLPAEQIVQYYSAPFQQIDEAKVILLGDGNVGKTYTVSRIINNCRAETPDCPYRTTATHGILIKPHLICRDGKDFHIQFWDFGGQDIMHSIHRCFLTRRTCYVIMVSTRIPNQTTARAKYWLHTIDYFAGSVPVILAVNCWGGKTSCTGLDESRLRAQFPALSDVVYFSAISSPEQELRKLEDTILERSRGCCSLSLPAAWDGVRQELLSQMDSKTYYIGQDVYQAICDRQGLYQDEQVRAWLLEWLNDLGVCFSYRLKPSCREAEDYKVLNPQWLTSAIYKIIWAKGVTWNGIIPRSEVQRILSSPDCPSSEVPFLQGVTYSKTECAYILEVMRKFKVSYEANDTDEFIPALLPEPMPDIQKPADCQTVISFKLRYSFLPEGVVHQLMIYCFKHLTISKCWRRGLYLDFQELLGTEALIQTASGGGLEDCELQIDLYANPQGQPSSLMRTLDERLRSINSELHLSAEEFICAAEGRYSEWFSVERIRKLRQRNADILQGTDADYNIHAVCKTFGALLAWRNPDPSSA